MESLSDQVLLQQFAESRSEPAFRELVNRHIHHVHSVARRVTCNEDFARDVSQQVFTKLATRHDTIPKKLSLSAWCHVTTRSLAIDLVRREEARRRREQAYQQGVSMNRKEEADWSELEPVIDEVVGSLSPKDREVILLRFYQKKTHAEVGQALEVAEDAARMRVNRALAKMKTLLHGRGITTTTAALALILPAHAVSAAPQALAGAVTTSAVAAAGATSTAVSTASLFAAAKGNIITIAAVAIAAPVITFQQVERVRLESEIHGLRPGVAESVEPDALMISGPGNPERTAGGWRAGDLKNILSQRDPMARIRALIEFVDRIEAERIDDALSDLWDGGNSPAWDREFGFAQHMMLIRLAESSSGKALDLLKNGPVDDRIERATSVLAGLASRDLSAALAWLDDPDNTLGDIPGVGYWLAGSVAKEWVRQDSEAALEWAKSLAPDQRGGAMHGVLVSLATSDPGRAAEMAHQLQEGPERNELVRQISAYWARRSPDRAIEWAQHLADGEEREGAIGSALGSWAQVTPDRAAEFVGGLPVESRQRHLADVSIAWAQRSPDGAAGWLENQEEGPGKSAAMGHVLWNWTASDPEAASTWLAAQAPAPSRDVGVIGLVKAVFDRDPARALTWVDTISDEAMRERTLEHHWNRWMERDREAASSWGATHGLSAETHGPKADVRSFFESPSKILN
ncbi:MAG: sigma-70 family RNA polymerase sigma factor [Verrucomicrobiota bacterium]